MSFLIFLQLLGLVSILEGKFRSDYTYFLAAGGYLKLNIIPANWFEARLRCHLEGTVLASPLTDGLRLAMEIIMEQKGKFSVLTGIHSTFSRGDFHSVEGIPLSKINHLWVEDEPDNYHDKERCILMVKSGSFADVECSQPKPYICYKNSSSILPFNKCGTNDPAYELSNLTGSCYKFHSVPRNWSRAFMACTAEGGHLAIINSDVEAKVIKEIFAKHPPNTIPFNIWKDVAFMGFHDWGEHGEFLTIQGQTLSEAGYDKFAPGEPNNATTGEYCGAVYRSGLYDDLWCENRYPFICEKDPNSLTSGD